MLLGAVGSTMTAVAAIPSTPLRLPTAGPARAAAVSDAHVARHAVKPRVAAALGPAGELRGMVLNDQNVYARPLVGNIPEFPKMAMEGITSVEVYVYLYVATPTSSDVTSGTLTPTDAELQVVTAAAKASGLGVHLMPVLLNSVDKSWRGLYQPHDTKAFFASYTSQLMHYADLAQSTGVSLLYVGSENNLLEKFTAQWRAVIAAARNHYSGALSYMAIPGVFTRVRFWDRLDLAATSPYVSMGTDPLPTYARDLSAWRTVHNALFARLAAYAKIPLIFGEAGFNSQKGSFSLPQAEATNPGSPAPAAQADAYKALLDNLARTPGVYGVAWYRWSVGTTALDMGYSPAGKPAECVLAAHWSTNAQIRSIASAPLCDLHTLDAVAANLSIPRVQY